MKMGGPIVEVKQGKLKGKLTKNIRGGDYYSFQGIPYAKPPIGELRFKDPQPPESWNDVRDATKDGNSCYARDLLIRTISGAEDCLFLNVYTPQLPSQNVKPKPVMFWIYGGGFISGSGQKVIYGPDYLLKEDVVVVTFNYRVGVLGFANFKEPSLGVPGNAGLKDMVLALKWVNENISTFSGDPKNITIFGESAGAAAVHYLILSPTTKNLFHKAILQSGSALNYWARGQPTAELFAKVLGIDNWDEKKVFEVLKSLPVEKLHEAQEKIKEDFNFSVKRPFGPTLEVPSENSFLTEEPLHLIRTGNYHKVPLIIGYNSREGMFCSLFHILSGRQLPPPSDMEDMIPYTYNIPKGSEKSKEIAKEMERFYFGDKVSSLDSIYQLYTDGCFYRGIYETIKEKVQVSKAPIYFYRFSMDGKTNFFKKIMNINHPGASHADELSYLFYNTMCPSYKNEHSYENMTMKRMCKLWTSFARTGNPDFKSEKEKFGIEWKPVEKDELHYLDLGKSVTIGVNPDANRMAFWDTIQEVSSKYNQ